MNFFLPEGCGSGCARVGAMLTPYIAQVLLKSSLYSAISVYAVIGILAGINSLFLPTETLGLTLNQSGDQVTNGTTQIVNNDNQTDDPNNSTSTQWYFSSIDQINLFFRKCLLFENYSKCLGWILNYSWLVEDCLQSIWTNGQIRSSKSTLKNSNHLVKISILSVL